jgi:hypothetical protein
MKASDSDGIANHGGAESCGGFREGPAEALLAGGLRSFIADLAAVLIAVVVVDLVMGADSGGITNRSHGGAPLRMSHGRFRRFSIRSLARSAADGRSQRRGVFFA